MRITTESENHPAGADRKPRSIDPIPAGNGRNPRPLGLVAVMAFAVLVLQGCETLRVGPPAVGAAATRAAEQAEKAGEYVLAAREYARLAEAAAPPQKQNFQLRAVDALLKAGQLPKARELIRSIDVTGLDSSFLARRRILEARIMSAEGRSETAIRLLNDAERTRNLSPALLAELYQVRAEAEIDLGNPIGAAKNLIGREQYLVDREAIDENQLRLWNTLAGLSRARLASELNITRDRTLAGWIELAIISIENAGRPTRLANALESWKRMHPGHPAGEALLKALASTKPPGLIGRIDHIALLLPLSSSYRVAAEAVRDGFMAMHDADGNPNRPDVRVYDLGDDPAQATVFYQQAARDGAQMIVGPLGKDAADKIVELSDLSVPALLLGHTDEDKESPYLFQFGLPPEQEARQAAERAYLDGHRQAAILAPRSAWGERMVNAFSGYWQRLGGLVLATGYYDETQSDYSEPISRLLNITESETRRRLLETKLGQKLAFEARPRQDVDFIFLAADARHGRLIKPQLNYYHAADIPVYSTSQIFTGRPDPVHDIDLDGILFGDMPWMLVNDGRIAQLRAQLQGDWPYAHSELDRLYALGMDSYAIVSQLNRIASDSGARFNGVTSGLSLEPNGHLHRQLLWARFKNGVPQLLDPLQTVWR